MSDLETVARAEKICLGCGGEKGLGLAVCWHCFKRRTDITPLNVFAGTFEDWVARFARRN
jgi:hypothetical protein